MNELRMIVVAALCGVFLVACGDDDRPPGGDLGMRDMNVPPSDLGPPVDGGPGTDLGPRPDGGGMAMCPAGACDLVTNGCGAGMGCYLLAMGAGTPAVPTCDMSGIGVQGASCMAYSDCAAGFVCVGETATTPGTCEKYCCNLGSSAGCAAGASCSISLTDAMGMPSGAGLCNTASNCMLFGSDCTGGEACFLSGGDGTTDCVTPGTGAAGANCMFTNDCMAGFSCIGPTGATKCRKLCDTVDMDPACVGTDVCTTLRIPAPLANVGSCVPPAMTP